MGGNALAAHGAKRISKAEANKQFLIVQELLFTVAKKANLSFRFELIKAYREKADFGDLDILVSLKPGEIMDLLSKTALGSQPFIRNGSVVSVGMPLDEGGLLQVDLISAPANEFDFSYGYFAWNDLGNLVGRIAHKMGLKFGHDGLWLPLRNGTHGTHLFDQILLTRDFKEALDFLGFDGDEWSAGFDNVEQIYSYVAKGARFNPDIYRLENRNHTARVRDKKRPVYMGFLAWLDARKNLPRYEWSTDKASYLPQILNGFPDAKIKYDASVARLKKTSDQKLKFNGSLVSAITGLKEKELGVFIAEFKHENVNFLDEILLKNNEQIQDQINAYYKRKAAIAIEVKN